MNILEARRRVLGGEIYKKTAEGNPVSVRSLARMRPGLKLFGRSEQFTTTGAQLLDVDNLSPDPSANYITSLIISDGGYEWEETSAFTTNRYLIAVKPNTNYTLSVGSITRGANLQISDYLQETKTGLDHVVSVDTTAFSFNTGELSEVTMSLFSDLTGIQKITDIMLCEGANVKPWEPYTGDKPSPSPDYPQEIENAGDDGSIQVDVYGGNLWDGGEFAIVTSSSTTGYAEGPRALTEIIKQLPIGQYSVSYTTDGNGTQGSSYGKIAIYEGGTIIIGASQTIELTNDIKNRMDKCILYGFRNQTQTVQNFMLNKGSTSLPFEPYKQPQSLIVSTPNGLPGIPVDSGGNYTDENGQQWVCDEIDLERGKYVQRVKKFIVTSDTKISSTNKYATAALDVVQPFRVDGYQNQIIRSSAMMAKNFVFEQTWNVAKEAAYTVEQTIDFNILNERIGTNAESTSREAEAAVREWLKDNPLTFLCQLITPIETDLTPEQITAYQSLYTYSPTTTVSNDAGAWMKFKYKTRKSLEVTT